MSCRSPIFIGPSLHNVTSISARSRLTELVCGNYIKGHVERNHGTYQDRLVKELRLAGISTIEAGNQFLQTSYCQQLNEKFAVALRARANYHRSAKGYDLASIFCIEEERSVTTDWTVRFANQYYQLQPLHKAAVGKGTVRVRRYLNGELHFCYRDRELLYTLLPERPKPKLSLRRKTKSAGALMTANSTYRQQIMCGAVFNLAKDRLGLAEPKATSRPETQTQRAFSK